MATFKRYALLLFLFALTPPAFTDEPIVLVRPVEVFQHEVEVKVPASADYCAISITGPRMFSRISPCVADQKDHSAKPSAYNWYKIVGDIPSALTSVSIKDPTQNNQTNQTIRLGNPSYFLIPTIILGDSQADEGSSSANVMLAFEYPGFPVRENSVDKRKSYSYYCLPVNQRHHDEIYKVARPFCEYVVLRTNGLSMNGEISSVDQFGLHRVKRLSSPYAVRSAGPSKP